MVRVAFAWNKTVLHFWPQNIAPTYNVVIYSTVQPLCLALIYSVALTHTFYSGARHVTQVLVHEVCGQSSGSLPSYGHPFCVDEKRKRTVTLRASGHIQHINWIDNHLLLFYYSLIRPTLSNNNQRFVVHVWPGHGTGNPAVGTQRYTSTVHYFEIQQFVAHTGLYLFVSLLFSATVCNTKAVK